MLFSVVKQAMRSLAQKKKMQEASGYEIINIRSVNGIFPSFTFGRSKKRVDSRLNFRMFCWNSYTLNLTDKIAKYRKQWQEQVIGFDSSSQVWNWKPGKTAEIRSAEEDMEEPYGLVVESEQIEWVKP